MTARTLALLSTLGVGAGLGGASVARAEDTPADAGTQASPNAAAEAKPTVTAQDTGGLFTVQGSETIDAPRKAVFAVVSDFAHMSSFISSVKESSVTAHAKHQLTVEQTDTGKAGPFSREMHTTLSVTEQPTRKLTFSDTSKKSFDTYEGSWSLRSAPGGGTTATYVLKAKPHGMAPGGIVKDAFKSNVEKMLTEVRAEVEKRAGTASATP